MNSDLYEDTTDKDFKDKVAACLKMRADSMRAKQNR
jgi:hypothetical protein